MYKIGVIGDSDSISGFASAGLSVYPTEDPTDAGRILKSIAEDHAVIFITEKLASVLDGEIERYASQPLPAIIPIPGITGNTGIGMKCVSRFVEQAVGSDILAD